MCPLHQGTYSIVAVVTFLKYKKTTIDHYTYVRVFSDITVSYLTFSTDNVINTTRNETSFTELKDFLKNTLI